MPPAHRNVTSALLALVLLLPVPGGAQSVPGIDGCTPAWLDHVPIAVSSLNDAERTYERLGFRLKPGRPHANGLRNAFVKFSEGDYLELISPERGATDATAVRYVDRLSAGEGGAFLALRVSSARGASARLAAANIVGDVRRYGSAFTTMSFSAPDLGWLFLIEYAAPVNDSPALLAHSNTAAGVEAVWVTADAHASLSAVAGALCLPEIRIAPAPSGSAPVQGVTLRVTSVDRAREVLRENGLDVPIRNEPEGRSVLVPAERAHGLWIELLQPDSKTSTAAGAGATPGSGAEEAPSSGPR